MVSQMKTMQQKLQRKDIEMIKPIETIYNGYRFRSRLEARWAVFFDEMGIKYEYEAEGYDLGKLGWYLPDFWLPDAKWHIEIKPAGTSDIELKRAHCFDKNPPSESMGIIVLMGSPNSLPSAGQEMWHGKLRDNYGSNLSNVEYLCMRCKHPYLLGYQAAIVARSARFEHGESLAIK